MSDRFTSAIIVAAGDSTRMGGKISKQLIPIAGAPAIEHTIRAFQDCELIDEIVVVARSVDIDDVANIVFSYKKVMAVISGGAERIDSVRRGLQAASRRATHLAIHDGARILITEPEIRRVLKAAYAGGAAALGTPVTDTVKVVTPELEVASTPDRSTLYAVQTPQVFERGLYMRALENAAANSLKVTDDCSLVEAIGERVRIVRGEYSNIKLTTPLDLTLAEAVILKRR